MATHIDPICNTQLEEAQAPAQSHYRGEAYYFCSLSCKSKFDEAPWSYLEGEREAIGTELIE